MQNRREEVCSYFGCVPGKTGTSGSWNLHSASTQSQRLSLLRGFLWKSLSPDQHPPPARAHGCVRSSRVEVTDPPAPSGHAKRRVGTHSRRRRDPVRYWEYLNPSRLAFAASSLDSFTAATVFVVVPTPCRRSETRVDASLDVHLKPGSTEVHSSIEHILETGSRCLSGLRPCDASIARSWGIPSRYVSGLSP